MIPEALWSELEMEAKRIAGTGVLKRMVAPDAACTMFLGILRPSLNRLFLLHVPRNILPSREQIPESRGFELNVQITGEEANTDATFMLTATDPMYNEMFSAMVENLCQGLRECNDAHGIVRVFLERLAQWQQFLEKNGVNGLSEEGQRGLYGELFFLKHHLLPASDDLMSAVSAWTGPKNRQHDFQFSTCVVEVKACVAKQHQKLLIASEQQLDDSLVDNLFLFHLSLSSIDNHADTLVAIVSELRSALSPAFAAASAFEMALVQRGYLDAQSWRYQKTGFVIRESNVFRVTGDFPRLIERDLPRGVGDVTYSISVTECTRFSVPMGDVISLIRRGNK